MPNTNTLLVALPGILTTNHLESRAEPDTTGFRFFVSNTTTTVKITNIKLTLDFDFSGVNLTINGQSKSVPGSADVVVIDVNDLLPDSGTEVMLRIDANVGGTPSLVRRYSLNVLATYDAVPWPQIVRPSPITGGALVFSVVPD